MNSCDSRPTSIFFRPTKTPMPLSTWTIEIADLQVAEIRQERPRRGPPLLVGLTLLVEDVGFGPELERRRREAGIPWTGGRRRRARRSRARLRRDRSARPAPDSRRASRRRARRGPASAPRRRRFRRPGAPSAAPRPSRGCGRRTPSPAGVAMWRTSSSVPSASVSSAVAGAERGATVVPADDERRGLRGRARSCGPPRA